MVRNGSGVKQAIESTPTGATVSLYHDAKLTSVCRLHIVYWRYCLNVYQLLWPPETRGKNPFNFGVNSSQSGGMAAILVFITYCTLTIMRYHASSIRRRHLANVS